MRRLLSDGAAGRATRAGGSDEPPAPRPERCMDGRKEEPEPGLTPDSQRSRLRRQPRLPPSRRWTDDHDPVRLDRDLDLAALGPVLGVDRVLGDRRVEPQAVPVRLAVVEACLEPGAGALAAAAAAPAPARSAAGRRPRRRRRLAAASPSSSASASSSASSSSASASSRVAASISASISSRRSTSPVSSRRPPGRGGGGTRGALTRGRPVGGRSRRPFGPGGPRRGLGSAVSGVAFGAFAAPTLSSRPRTGGSLSVDGCMWRILAERLGLPMEPTGALRGVSRMEAANAGPYKEDGPKHHDRRRHRGVGACRVPRQDPARNHGAEGGSGVPQGGLDLHQGGEAEKGGAKPAARRAGTASRKRSSRARPRRSKRRWAARSSGAAGLPARGA